MARGTERGLVIDASVARSAGETEHPISKKCRGFLRGVRGNGFTLVISDEIRAEWQNHASVFTVRWRRSMVQRRKIARIGSPRNPALRADVSRAAGTRPDRTAMLKDVHLIEASIQSNSPIVSRDDKARGLFKGAGAKVRALRGVVWVNPTEDKERPLQWLANGAKPEPERRLGFGVVREARSRN